MGSALISLVGKPTLFHVVSDSVGFIQDGILGNRFLQDRVASIDYGNRCLHYDNNNLPFTELVNIEIKRRTVSPFYVNVTNPEKQCGYIPRITLTEGVYFGDAVVTNTNGKAYLLIVNVTETDCKIEIPNLELEDFDLVEGEEMGALNFVKNKEMGERSITVT